MRCAGKWDQLGYLKCGRGKELLPKEDLLKDKARKAPTKLCILQAVCCSSIKMLQFSCFEGLGGIVLPKGTEDARGQPLSSGRAGWAGHQRRGAGNVVVTDSRLQVVQLLGHQCLLLNGPQQRTLRLQVITCTMLVASAPYTSSLAITCQCMSHICLPL